MSEAQKETFGKKARDTAGCVLAGALLAPLVPLMVIAAMIGSIFVRRANEKSWRS